jgi:hypothetical protein
MLELVWNVDPGVILYLAGYSSRFIRYH